MKKRNICYMVVCFTILLFMNPTNVFAKLEKNKTSPDAFDGKMYNCSDSKEILVKYSADVGVFAGKFDDKNGIMSDTKKTYRTCVKRGEKTPVAPELKAEGYEFKGWKISLYKKECINSTTCSSKVWKNSIIKSPKPGGSVPMDNSWGGILYTAEWKQTGPTPTPSHQAPIDDSWDNISPGNYECGGIISSDLLKEIKKIYRTICMVMVVAVVIFGALDFVKATSSDDNDALKKAQGKFAKRFLIVIILLLLPQLLEFILSIFGDERMKNCLDKI